MENYDEILDCIFALGQMINEKGPSSVNIENISLNKEYAFLVKNGFSYLLRGIQIENILWRSEIIYYILNHPNITQHEILEILLMEQIIILFQNGPVDQLSEILYRYGSYNLISKYGEWLVRFIKSKKE